MSLMRLGVLRVMLRDFRSGDLSLLIAAVALAVCALSAVSLFADRLSAAFQRDARQLLGGDAVVVSDQPTPSAFLALAKQHGLTHVTTLSFPTMGRTSDAADGVAKLVALKAVAQGYPLRGHMKLLQTDGSTQITRDLPQQGTVWVDSSLLAALQIKAGDSLLLGESRFRIAQVIASEPDRGVGFMNFAPRVMVHADDLAKTQLIQPASRVTYRFAVMGKDDDVQRFKTQALLAVPQHKGVRLESLENGRPETKQILDTTEKFLNLVALLCAMVCAVAVAVASRSFAQKRIDDCALRRTLGQSQRDMVLTFGLEFLCVGVVASMLGCVLGLALHEVFVAVLAQVMNTELPAPSVFPLVFGMGVGVTLLLAFGLPPVLQLAGTPPLRVLRRDVGDIKTASWGALLLGLLAFAALLLVASKDFYLAVLTALGFAGAAVFFAGLAWLALSALGRSQEWGWMQATSVRLATRSVLAQKWQTVVQVSCLALGLLAMMMMILLRSDLLATWQQARAQDAPNRMVINVLPDQAVDFQAALHEGGIHVLDWFPMFRGRLVAVNDQPVHAAQYEDERAKRLVEREFNLSYAAQLPAHNSLVAGQWLAEQSNAISVEDGLAKTLGLKLGDRLSFEVAGQSSQATITSLRKVDWQSMRANFFVLYPVAQMPQTPVTFMSAYRVGPLQEPFDQHLVRRFPNITLIDLSQTVKEFQNVLKKVTLAVESLFAFTLVAGLLVVLATLRATSGHVQKEAALMRALGAQAGQLHAIHRVRLAGIGALAGVLASVVAWVLTYFVGKFVFNFEWHLPWWLPFVGFASGSALTLLTGIIMRRALTHSPVMRSLRSAE